jgi:5'(3')-deoxyribonucleotidase
VGRVLFDPNGSHSNEHRFVRLSSWHELRDVVLSRD